MRTHDTVSMRNAHGRHSEPTRMDAWPAAPSAPGRPDLAEPASVGDGCCLGLGLATAVVTCEHDAAMRHSARCGDATRRAVRVTGRAVESLCRVAASRQV